MADAGQQVIEDHDEKAHYDLARHLARAGERDPALAHLRRAADLLPAAGIWAAGDRDLPGFPRPG